MSGIPHEDKIKQGYKLYEQFLDCKKNVHSPFIIDEIRKEHPSSLCATTIINSEVPYGNAELYSEVKKADLNNYSISIKSDVIDSRILLRYDSEGLAHRNAVDYIPLAEQSVPTPHFHKFDKYGNLLAFQTEKLMDEKEAKALKNIEFGFAYFCQYSSTNKTLTEELPEVLVNSGRIPFDFNEDPIDGINFE